MKWFVIDENNAGYILISEFPDDFFINYCDINHDKYIIQFGFNDKNEWFSEYDLPVSKKSIIDKLLFPTSIKDIRYKERNSDENRNMKFKDFVNKNKMLKILNS